MSDWNAGLYNRFEKERQQPSIDLVHRIKKEDMRTIIDMGCGSGISTREIVNNWPEATVIGVDYSESMLEKARGLGLNVDWQRGDCSESLQHLKGVDLVFSNACLQWLDNHEQVLEHWFNLLNTEGAVAVQIPFYKELGIEKAIKDVIEMEKWSGYFEAERTAATNAYTASDYYNILSKYAASIEMWETDYIHVLPNQQSIVDFYKSTGLRPYLEVLEDKVLEEEFLIDLLDRVKVYYATEEDGNVLFPFKRFFFIAYK